ncbi:MAG: hypothetical protein C4543_00195 [Ignavibacteriales bacterium]|jgi:hypothetical protein|nr:MAG: hypothetical protein C4543_00195 [Ignavibacteriales bacterium]
MNSVDNKKAAEEFCIKIDEFAKGKLNNAEDLTRIAEIIFKINKQELLDEISFSAKYSQGLLKIIQNRSNNIEDDYFDRIKAEYTEAVKKIRELLKTILADGSPFIKQIFIDKYLSLTHESLNNLNLLMSDLSWVKMYLNDIKRSS